MLFKGQAKMRGTVKPRSHIKYINTGIDDYECSLEALQSIEAVTK